MAHTPSSTNCSVNIRCFQTFLYELFSIFSRLITTKFRGYFYEVDAFLFVDLTGCDFLDEKSRVSGIEIWLLVKLCAGFH